MVIRELSRLNRTEDLSRLAQHRSSSVRETLTVSASVMGGAEGTKVLKELAKNPDPETRMLVATTQTTFGNIEKVDSLQILRKLAKDPDAGVRVATAYSAGNIKDGAEVLKTLVNDPNEGIREQVIDSATRIGGTGGVEVLKEMMKDSDMEVRKKLARSAEIRNNRGSDGIVILRALMTDPAPEVRRRTARAAEYIGGTEGVQLLRELVNDSDKSVTITASAGIEGAVVKIVETEGTKPVQDMISGSSTAFRESVAWSARQMETAEGAKILRALMTDPSPDVRLKVATAAERMGIRKGGEEGKGILKELLDDPDDSVRFKAKIALEFWELK